MDDGGEVKCEENSDVARDSRLCLDEWRKGEGEGGKLLDTVGFPVVIWGLIPPARSVGRHARGGSKSGLG